ncbi:MAG: nicotinate (nicotinamide) nucleotide adenylyltransferase [Sulfurimonas sp.]|uniref:nicotinate (nicotinamide) nucleotide adenylyltransferase n=1 Tax=Sulfurimonas sp. TaxID=2022749 RepID=UPI0025F7CE87|nr:nicotinate (nicotinamide) nucleotide adenylyltransferase [Sulfurimonas sp.]MCK9491144.1 nicotinate (nicotinamide) nucleotide adenylyltransferase [Sulfurimonas sp.]
METIALYGGSFDPPHIAHEALVKALLEIKEIDKVIVMPTYLNPFKSNFFAPSELRLKWLREIFSEVKEVEVSDYEVRQNKKVPSIQSVKHLLKRFKKIYLVIGADNLTSLHKWEGFDELNNLVTFIVAQRDRVDIPDGYISLNIDINISSTMLREDLDRTKLPSKCADEIIKFYQGNKCNQE